MKTDRNWLTKVHLEINSLNGGQVQRISELVTQLFEKSLKVERLALSKEMRRMKIVLSCSHLRHTYEMNKLPGVQMLKT